MNITAKHSANELAERTVYSPGEKIERRALGLPACEPAPTGIIKPLPKGRSLAKKTATEVAAANQQAELLTVIALKFTRKTGENDQMFGSVTAADISEALAAQGFKIDKRQVQLAEPIRIIGESQVTIKVFRDVTAQIKVTVEKES